MVIHRVAIVWGSLHTHTHTLSVSLKGGDGGVERKCKFVAGASWSEGLAKPQTRKPIPLPSPHHPPWTGYYQPLALCCLSPRPELLTYTHTQTFIHTHTTHTHTHTHTHTQRPWRKPTLTHVDACHKHDVQKSHGSFRRGAHIAIMQAHSLPTNTSTQDPHTNCLGTSHTHTEPPVALI